MGSSHEPCEVGQHLHPHFTDGETEAQRRVMTCQTKNDSSCSGTAYPAIPPADMFHQLLVIHSLSFSTPPSVVGDGARAASHRPGRGSSRDRAHVGSFNPCPEDHPSLQEVSQPKGCFGVPPAETPQQPHAKLGCQAQHPGLLIGTFCLQR